MKKQIIIAAMAMVLLPQVAQAKEAVTVLIPREAGMSCDKNDYTFIQGYRSFWSYVRQIKPSNYPGYWALVPTIYVDGYGGTVCRNVVEKGYGTINLKKKVQSE